MAVSLRTWLLGLIPIAHVNARVTLEFRYSLANSVKMFNIAGSMALAQVISLARTRVLPMVKKMPANADALMAILEITVNLNQFASVDLIASHVRTLVSQLGQQLGHVLAIASKATPIIMAFLEHIVRLAQEALITSLV